ncbi:hypothetical protein BY996DRAFT_6505186 [Phakopsora pachyrhizi]|nr:hypothetical protein BY996DRAFT_6505186 [Phakopsora pachyrhizi]
MGTKLSEEKSRQEDPNGRFGDLQGAQALLKHGENNSALTVTPLYDTCPPSCPYFNKYLSMTKANQEMVVFGE